MNVWRWLNDTDPGTWVGHWLQGLVGFWVGYFAIQWLTVLPGAAAMTVGVLTGFLVVALVFAHREADNILAGIKEYGARLAIREKGLDGLMDWLMPALACFCDINLLFGGLSAFAASVLGSAIVWAIASIGKHGKGG